MSRVRIAVAGAGMIGKRHVEEVDACDDAPIATGLDGPGGVLAQRHLHHPRLLGVARCGAVRKTHRRRSGPLPAPSACREFGRG